MVDRFERAWSGVDLVASMLYRVRLLRDVHRMLLFKRVVFVEGEANDSFESILRPLPAGCCQDCSFPDFNKVAGRCNPKLLELKRLMP